MKVVTRRRRYDLKTHRFMSNEKYSSLSSYQKRTYTKSVTLYYIDGKPRNPAEYIVKVKSEKNHGKYDFVWADGKKVRQKGIEKKYIAVEKERAKQIEHSFTPFENEYSQHIKHSRYKSIIRQNIYNFDAVRIDRIKDPNLAAFLTETFIPQITKKYKRKSKDTFLTLYVRPTLDSSYVRVDVQIMNYDDYNYNYIKIINAIMKVLRDAGLYLEKSAWRYEKMKKATKKSMADSVHVYGYYTVQWINKKVKE